MYTDKFNLHHHKGSKLLLLTGTGLVLLVAFLIVCAQPIIPPQTLILDDGRIIISKCSQPPEEILKESGFPLRELDSIERRDDFGSVSDTVYEVKRAREILVVDAGNIWKTHSLDKTIRDLVTTESAKFNLQALDRVTPSLDTPLKDKMKIMVTRVTVKEETRTEKIPPDYKLVNDPDLVRGKMVTDKPGKSGVKEATYRNYFKNGKLSSSQRLSERTITKPEPGVKRVGSRVITMSRSGYRGKRVLEMTATAYDAGPLSTGKSADGITATGAKAQHGIVAVDPKVIPLGTKLFIEGYGYAVAADTGGAIKGLRIDLFYESRKEALIFGRRKVKVYILE